MEDNTKYLTEEQIIEINKTVILFATPKEPIQVKMPTALNAAVEAPKQTFGMEELYSTITQKAAILFQLLVQKHIFANGNKRTAYTATYIFLYLNGLNLKPSTKEAVDFTVKIAKDSLEKEIIEAWIKSHIVQI